ncbi:MAG: NAD-dependent epimerase/dehydratase family protein [Acidimicrobiia bacterium]
MRVLVTGGAGFIGSTLVERLLVEGNEVDAVDDLSSGSLGNLAEARGNRSLPLSFHRLDVRSENTVAFIAHRQPEVIFHLAAQIDVRVSVTRPAFDAEVNVLGTLNVCEGAVAAGTRKVVFAGSGGTLYGTPEVLPTPETHPRQPISPYGVAKKAAGDYLYYYREIRGLDFTVLALANVYGPRQDPHGEAGVVAIFASRLLARERPTIFGDGEQTRDFVYVNDVVDAFSRAQGDAGGGQLLNIGTGKETSVKRLLELMSEITGYPESPEIAPARPGELARSALDPKLAERTLGWRPAAALQDGLKQTVDWFSARSPGRRG